MIAFSVRQRLRIVMMMISGGFFEVLDQAVSRVLCRQKVALVAVMIIHLGQQLPVASSDQPENDGRAVLYVLLFGLAPDGVYQAFPVTRETGELLPRLFTLTRFSRGEIRRYIFCGTFLRVAPSRR